MSSRLPFVPILLALTLGVAGALAWQAHRAAESHEAAASRVQQDYVEFAGWEFSRVAGVELTNRLDRWLQVIGCAAASGPLPEPAGLANGAGCRCDDLAAESLFKADLATGALAVTGARLGRETERWIRGTIDGDPRIPPSHHGYLLHAATIDGLPRVIAAAHARDRSMTPRAIVGFVASAEAVAPAFKHVFERTPLLPPTLAGRRNELLGVRVTTRDGAVVFAADDEAGRVRAAGTLPESLRELIYEISLRRGAAERLVIGGLPRSRVPLLLGLLALTAGLMLAAVLQLRREHALARMRADFVASVSHELRTPLAQIRLFSETLLLGRVRSEDEARRSLEIIQQESRRLTHLVDNVLYFSRSGRRAQALVLASARLSLLASEVIEAFAPIARAGRATVRLDVRTDVEAPVDTGAMRQILLNLLDNAVKYGKPEQTVTVTIDHSGPRAVVIVDDEGPGVPAEARGRIWQPYSRLATASASAVAGAGIGLAVVRELVTLHRGAVRVETAPAGGARFIVELPDAAPAAGSEAIASSAGSSVPA